MNLDFEKDRIIGTVRIIREEYQKFLERELSKRGIHGLVSSHGSILAVLYKMKQQNITMQELAKIIRRTKSTTTVLVNKLVRLEYIKKTQCLEDKRNFFVTITPKGESIQKDFEEISKKLLKTFYKGLNESEKDTLVKLLLHVKDSFEEENKTGKES